MGNRIDVPPGTRFGRLVVVSETEPASAHTSQPRRRFLCKCDCGNECEVTLTNMRYGHTSSCGCVRVELGKANATHRKSHCRIYNVWDNMIQRCHNPNRPDYRKYGARGIAVCQRWLKSFDAFLEDMGEPPSPKHSIDRIDNDKGYFKDNCRWATSKEQSRNTRRNVMLTYENETMCLSDWASKAGINRVTFYDRIRKGWSMKDALTLPVKGSRQ